MKKEVNIADTLREIRCKSGYTQQQIADILNCSRSTYTYYELGKTSPDIRTLIKLAKVFNTSVSAFLGEEAKIPKVSDPTPQKFPFGKKNASHIYELSEREIELVGAFRAASQDRQDAILEFVKNTPLEE